MAEGGNKEETSGSTLLGSEDYELSPSILLGSQDVYEYYCQPCDGNDNHVEATFYCRNCKEYMCKTCITLQQWFKHTSDHDIMDIRDMTNKPPVRKKKPRAIIRASHVKDIKIKGIIIGSALMSTNQLLVADYANNSVRLVDTALGRQVSELKLSNSPWQVTRINDTEAAVTVPSDEKIVLLKTQPQFSLEKEIKVQAWCRGIAYSDSKLIVTFSDGSINILDMTGQVLHTISADKQGKKIFNWPGFVKVDPASGSMYVTDLREDENGWLVKLSMNGSVMAT